jgi:hypothetical protein
MHFQTILFTLAAISLSLVSSAPIPITDGAATPVTSPTSASVASPSADVTTSEARAAVYAASLGNTDCPICLENLSSESKAPKLEVL